MKVNTPNLPIWLLSQDVYFKWFTLWNLKRAKKIVKGNRWIFSGWERMMNNSHHVWRRWWVIMQEVEKIKYLEGGVWLKAYLLILQLKVIVKIETQVSIWHFRTQAWRIWRKKCSLAWNCVWLSWTLHSGRHWSHHLNWHIWNPASAILNISYN